MLVSESPLVAVVDYGIGNLRSAQKALEHVGADARLTDDPALIERADAVVLPGVGAFGRCAQELAARGLDGPTLDAARSGRPFLGICIGMQLLYEGSEESPNDAGLGVLSGTVRRLRNAPKLPQMQWNRLETSPGRSRLLDRLGDRPWVYFVHSYAAPDPNADEVVATCEYGEPVVAMIERGPLVATQFHPEKSGRVGLELLRGFVEQAAA